MPPAKKKLNRYEVDYGGLVIVEAENPVEALAQVREHVADRAKYEVMFLGEIEKTVIEYAEGLKNPKDLGSLEDL